MSFSLNADANGAAAMPPREDTPLLRRRMAGLRIEPGDLVFDGALLFSDLQRLCRSCQRKQECEAGLDNEFTDPGWDRWRNYCPDATTLSVSSMLSACRDTQG